MASVLNRCLCAFSLLCHQQTAYNLSLLAFAVFVIPISLKDIAEQVRYRLGDLYSENLFDLAFSRWYFQAFLQLLLTGYRTLAFLAMCVTIAGTAVLFLAWFLPLVLSFRFILSFRIAIPFRPRDLLCLTFSFSSVSAL